MAGFSVRPSRNKCGYCKQECLHITPGVKLKESTAQSACKERVVLGGFVYSWTAEATTYLFNNKQFPPTLTCEMCYVVAVNKEQDKNNK